MIHFLLKNMSRYHHHNHNATPLFCNHATLSSLCTTIYIMSTITPLLYMYQHHNHVTPLLFM